ncbi:transcription factor 24-like [Conger conger]|uniref:transcription factor 24-like n=1 Tax=Conger conger TaxID=82655 RepID=UPI002A5A07A5|nr:transcription factor 24-like [Conger conger]
MAASAARGRGGSLLLSPPGRGARSLAQTGRFCSFCLGWGVQRNLMAESRHGDGGGMEGGGPSGARGPRAGGGHSAGRDSGKGVRCGPGGQKLQVYPANAARERSRVRNLRQAFHSLQAALPSVPPNTKLSKLDVLVLATNYIAHLTQTLDQGEAPAERPPLYRAGGYLHPVKKWPMRSLLYCGSVGDLLSGAPANQKVHSGEDDANPLAPDGEGHTDWTSQK